MLNQTETGDDVPSFSRTHPNFEQVGMHYVREDTPLLHQIAAAHGTALDIFDAVNAVAKILVKVPKIPARIAADLQKPHARHLRQVLLEDSVKIAKLGRCRVE